MDDSQDIPAMADEEQLASALFAIAGHLIRRTQQVTVAIYLDRLSAFDVTPIQYVHLYIIAKMPGIDQARVAGYAALDRSNVGDVLKRLEKRGLITRRVNSQDKRARRLFLSEAGHALFAQLEPLVLDVQDEVLAPLDPDERAHFLRMLLKVSRVDRQAATKPFSRAASSK